MIGIEKLATLNLAAALTAAKSQGHPYKPYNVEQVDQLDPFRLPVVSYQVEGFAPGQEWLVDVMVLPGEGYNSGKETVLSVSEWRDQVRYLVSEGFGLYFGVTHQIGDFYRIKAFSPDVVAGVQASSAEAARIQLEGRELRR